MENNISSSNGSGCRSPQRLSRMMSFGISDVALERVMDYIDDPRDRDAISLVSWRWYHLDRVTRKHITIALCYSSTPDRLCRRFPGLKSLKLKGKPRASMFNNIIPDDWGGYAAPWVARIADGFTCLESIHLRRMILKDDDVSLLVRSRGEFLKSLKFDKCSGFSTDALVLIARSCSVHECSRRRLGLLPCKFFVLDFALTLRKAGDALCNVTTV